MKKIISQLASLIFLLIISANCISQNDVHEANITKQPLITKKTTFTSITTLTITPTIKPTFESTVQPTKTPKTVFMLDELDLIDDGTYLLFFSGPKLNDLYLGKLDHDNNINLLIKLQLDIMKDANSGNLGKVNYVNISNDKILYLDEKDGYQIYDPFTGKKENLFLEKLVYLNHPKDSVVNFENPFLSPDKKWVATSAYQLTFSDIEKTTPTSIDDYSSIFLINRQSNLIHRLTISSGIENLPSWSPDGKLLVYVSDEDRLTEYTGQTDLFMMPTTCLDQLETCYQQSMIITKNWSEYLFRVPSWAPDSHSIAARCESEGQSDICLIDIITNMFNNLTESEDLIEINPFWSNDGKKIFFTEFKLPGEAEKIAGIDLTTEKKFYVHIELPYDQFLIGIIKKGD